MSKKIVLVILTLSLVLLSAAFVFATEDASDAFEMITTISMDDMEEADDYSGSDEIPANELNSSEDTEPEMMLFTTTAAPDEEASDVFEITTTISMDDMEESDEYDWNEEIPTNEWNPSEDGEAEDGASYELPPIELDGVDNVSNEDILVYAMDNEEGETDGVLVANKSNNVWIIALAVILIAAAALIILKKKKN